MYFIVEVSSWHPNLNLSLCSQFSTDLHGSPFQHNRVILIFAYCEGKFTCWITQIMQWKQILLIPKVACYYSGKTVWIQRPTQVQIMTSLCTSSWDICQWLTCYKPNKQNMKKKKTTQKWQWTIDIESTVPPKSDLMMNLLSTPSCLSVSLL